MILVVGKWWGHDAAEWEAIGVCVATLFTFIGLCFAIYQFRDSRTVRLDRSRPIVTIDPTFRSILVKLCVRNTGETTARNIRIKFDDALHSTLSNGLTWLPNPYVKDISSLAPHSQLEYLFDKMSDRLSAGMTGQITGTIEYFGPTQHRRWLRKEAKPYTEPFTVDLAPYGESLMADKSIHDLAESVEGIRSEVRKWSEGTTQTLSVDVTNRDRQEFRKWLDFTWFKVASTRRDDGRRAALSRLVRELRQRYGLPKY